MYPTLQYPSFKTLFYIRLSVTYIFNKMIPSLYFKTTFLAKCVILDLSDLCITFLSMPYYCLITIPTRVMDVPTQLHIPTNLDKIGRTEMFSDTL